MTGTSWKTTSAGVLAIVGALTTLAFAVIKGVITPELIIGVTTGLLTGVGLLFAKDSNVTGGDVSNGLTVPRNSSNAAKGIGLIFLLLGLGLACSAQEPDVNTHHLFGKITAKDIPTMTTTKVVNGVAQTTITSTQAFLRLAVAETAWEVPLKKGVPQQFFAATGIGVSLAFYGVKNGEADEKFTLNALIFTPNTDTKINGTSLAVTAGVPIPLLNFPILNAGIRVDLKTGIPYLQTGINLEF